MSPPREEARHNSGLPQEATTATEDHGSSELIQGVNHLIASVLTVAARLPYWVPSWLDKLAVLAAKRLGREGKL